MTDPAALRALAARAEAGETGRKFGDYALDDTAPKSFRNSA